MVSLSSDYQDHSLSSSILVYGIKIFSFNACLIAFQDNIMIASQPSISRPELLNIFEKLQKKFDTSLSFSQKQDKQFKESCKNFQIKMSQYLDESSKDISKENPLFNQMEIFREILEETNKDWHKRIEKQDTGVHFRAGFNDSLLVFVYGKVKSGKSSLGNYMAWGHTDPTDELKKEIALQPEYFSGKKTNVKSGDAEKEAENKKEFRVGATEATSSIQGFSLAGLTWIDSPGLHSISKENGDLAKDYVEHADLILYTMKSDAPGRGSDVDEILELYCTDKKILLLLTGSDTTNIKGRYKDEAGKLIIPTIMKNQETRLTQQEYVRSALADRCKQLAVSTFQEELKGLENLRKMSKEDFLKLGERINNIKILSFSARYAQENQENVENFSDGGMGQLFASLGKIASEDGVRLKLQTPISNFSLVLTSFMGDLEKYKKLIVDFGRPIEKIQKDIPIQINQQKVLIQRELDIELDRSFDNLTQYRDDAMQMNQAIKKIADNLSNKQNQLIIQAQSMILEQIMNEFGSTMITAIESNTLLNLPEFEIKQRTERIVDSINQGTRRTNSGKGALLGGAIGAGVGFLFGGPAGAAAGASLGSAAGGYVGGKTGDDASNNYRDITLNVGDNLPQIRQQFAERVKNSIQTQMTNFEESVLEYALNSASNLVSQLQAEIKDLKCQLDGMNLEINRELAKLGEVK